LRQEKGFGAKRLLKEFPNKNWSVNSLNKLLQNLLGHSVVTVLQTTVAGVLYKQNVALSQSVQNGGNCLS